MVLTSAVLSAAALTGVTAPAQAAWAPPAFVRSIGGRGAAGLYAWGVQQNPVTGDILVGDYSNNQIRRFRTDGTLAGSSYAPETVRKGHPESVAVDPNTGAYYSSDRSSTNKGYMVKFDAAGNFLYQFTVSATYQAWMVVEADGSLLIADSHVWHNAADPPQVRRYTVDDTTKAATEVASWGTYGTGPGEIQQLTGLDVDSAGNVYGADTLNRVVHVWAHDGTWVRDFGTPANNSWNLNPGMLNGDLRGVAVDEAHDAIYVVDARVSQIEKFRMDGTPVLNWGSTGTGPGQFGDGGRQVAVDSDGNVWAPDFSNTRLMKFDPGGALLGTYPDPAQPAPAGGFARVIDVAVEPATGDVFAVEFQNHRFQRFHTDGTFVGVWGSRSSDPPYGMNWPRGIAVDPATSNLWVADTLEDCVRVYDPAMNFLFQIGTVHDTTTGNFKGPMDIEFYGGKAFVSDQAGGRLKVFDPATGTELSSISRAQTGVAINPDNGDIYIVAATTRKVFRYNAAGTLLGSWGTAGTGDGQFQTPWDIDISGGVIYITDTVLDRVQAFTLSGSYLGKWGGLGTAAGLFTDPSGITHDAAGRIYVADAGNERIQVFDPVASPPVGDTAKPSVALGSPTTNQQIVLNGQVDISGTATDNVALGSVEVSVRDSSTGLWWNARNATWQSVRVWNLANTTGSATNSMSWRMPFVGVAYSGSYYAQARAYDTSRNVSAAQPSVNFTTLPKGGQLDAVAPDATVSAPAANAVLPSAPVPMSGTATDNVAVGAVKIAVQNTVSKLWWHSDGTWGAFASYDATLATPGAPTTGWSYVWTPPSPGAYALQVEARDTSQNKDATKPWIKFSVT